MGMLFRSVSSPPPRDVVPQQQRGGQRVTRELVAPPPPTLSYTNVGLFGVIMTMMHNKLDDLLWYAMPNLDHLTNGISNEGLACAKLALKASICSLYDRDIVSGETMAAQIQTIGRVMPLAEALTRVDTLPMADFKATAGEVINDQNHSLAAIGGICKLLDYNWIHRHSYMLWY